MKYRKWTLLLCTGILSLSLSQAAFAAYYCTQPGDEANSQLTGGTFTDTEQGRRFTGSDGQVYVNHWLYYEKTRTWYYFDGNGIAVTGFQNVDGKRRYFNKFGQLIKSRIIVGGNVYFGDSKTGEILTSLNGGNEKRPSYNGKKYVFDEQGIAHGEDGNYDYGTMRKLNPAWKEEDKKWTYVENGQKLRNAWHQDNGMTFYFDENGYMVYNTVKQINGKEYKFTSNGVLLTSEKLDHITVDGARYSVGSDGGLTQTEAAPVKSDYALTEEQQAADNRTNPYQNNQTVQWINATYAIMTKSNGENIRMFGGRVKLGKIKDSYREADDYDRARMREGLVTSWGVTDRATADAALSALIADGNATGSAWDYSRAMSNLGFYYRAEYYTEAEALDKSLELAKVIQTRFSSWDQFVNSYLEGYAAWAGAGEDRRAIYEGLKTSAFNPYAIDWNLKLEKSW